MTRHTFFCIDAHTCGKPVRVVARGAPSRMSRWRRKENLSFLVMPRRMRAMPSFTERRRLIGRRAERDGQHEWLHWWRGSASMSAKHLSMKASSHDVQLPRRGCGQCGVFLWHSSECIRLGACDRAKPDLGRRPRPASRWLPDRMNRHSSGFASPIGFPGIPRESALSDVLDIVQLAHANYFVEGADDATSLPYDRRPVKQGDPFDLVSIGAVGFSILAILVMAFRQWIAHPEACRRTERILDSLEQIPRFKGAFPHFVRATTLKVVQWIPREDGAYLRPRVLFRRYAARERLTGADQSRLRCRRLVWFRSPRRPAVLVLALEH